MSWAKATMYRVIRTGAQAAIGAIGAAAALSQVAWDEVAGIVGIAMLVSFLMALAGLPETPDAAPLENVPLEGDDGQTNLQSILIVAAISFAVTIIVLLVADLITL